MPELARTTTTANRVAEVVACAHVFVAAAVDADVEVAVVASVEASRFALLACWTIRGPPLRLPAAWQTCSCPGRQASLPSDRTVVCHTLSF